MMNQFLKTAQSIAKQDFCKNNNTESLEKWNKNQDVQNTSAFF